MKILETNSIIKTYKKNNEKINVLNNIDISVNKGEIVVLMGPSGSGKSTLLNILGTLETNFSGNLFIENKLIKEESDRSIIRREKLGFVFQFHHLLPEFTVYENLLIPITISGKGPDAVNEIDKMLKYVDMLKRKYHYPSELSGGERQRIAILRALINSPAIVIADEPTGNLDAENSQLLLELIVNLHHKYNQTFIIATHDSLVLNIATRVLYLNNGKIKKGEN